VLDFILVAVYEGVYFFKQWKQSLLKTEKLEKEFLSSKFEALKNQINPHFLFNSLNTLSALIHEDVDKSEKFIDEFAKIYRYVLENQENIAVSLNNELAFVKSYLYLQQIRFGKSLDSEIKIDVSKLDYMIPTLSLQLLIENAIKHNKITKSDPLKIKIYNEEDYLVVENNLQLRDQKNDSTGIGLNNLKERYKLMTEHKPEFIVTEKSYVAKIPLIPEI
jgi:LytS/YehU family sensor histidine kinase